MLWPHYPGFWFSKYKPLRLSGCTVILCDWRYKFLEVCQLMSQKLQKESTTPHLGERVSSGQARHLSLQCTLLTAHKGCSEPRTLPPLQSTPSWFRIPVNTPVLQLQQVFCSFHGKIRFYSLASSFQSRRLFPRALQGAGFRISSSDCLSDRSQVSLTLGSLSLVTCLIESSVWSLTWAVVSRTFCAL